MSCLNKENYVVLSNNVKMPILGLGTTHSGGYNHDTVVYALKECNYRLIDTAKRYGVEKFVGRAIVDSGIPRSHFFLTTKLMPRDYASVRDTFFQSMNLLNTDYLDMYYLHWPMENKSMIEDTWRQLELLLDEEHVRSIGISNFEDDQILHMLDFASVIPHANQCEFNPYIQQKSTIKLCEENNIAFQGYCPLSKGKLMDEPVIQSWANKLNVSPAQVLIKWSLEKRAITIPKSTHKSRVLENSKVFNFSLPPKAMVDIDALHIGNSHRRCIKRDRITGETFDLNVKQDGYKLLRSKNVFPIDLL
uniref:Oxidoreductase ZK1290.5 n=2 Tax=Lepeophtheirus salmonis TaxID=72036 RepID=D3PHE9_LEPSM|nr:oxidoreductase ZK1290.5 [Lepeophtheirus salmonis]